METASLTLIEKLHPAIRALARAAYTEAVRQTPVGVHPVITETLRSFKRSEQLYQQGRTKPGAIVTNAKAGQSYHNYGLALDYALQVLGKISWNVDSNWRLVADIFKQHGFVWGGDFKSIKDYPHVELRPNDIHWRDLLKLYNTGRVDAAGYVLL